MTNDCPAHNGYTFEGWYTDSTAGEQVYDNTGTRVVGTYWDSEGKWIGTSDVTLYAHWTPISYTITWNQDDGTNIDQTEVDYGQLPTHSNPIKEPTSDYTYTFTGWQPEIVPVTSDATYIAKYDKIAKQSTQADALPSEFSVGSDKKVRFSKGNLQYQASTDTWRFILLQSCKRLLQDGG